MLCEIPAALTHVRAAFFAPVLLWMSARRVARTRGRVGAVPAGDSRLPPLASRLYIPSSFRRLAERGAFEARRALAAEGQHQSSLRTSFSRHMYPVKSGA